MRLKIYRWRTRWWWCSNWIYDERSVVKDADVAQLVEELAPPLASNGTLARHFCWGLILAMLSNSNIVLYSWRLVLGFVRHPVANYGAGSLAPSVSKYLHTAWMSRYAYVVQKICVHNSQQHSAQPRSLPSAEMFHKTNWLSVSLSSTASALLLQ